MRNDFAVFILTHGRPHKQMTLRTLKRCNYTGKVYFVIDNEDDKAAEYYRLYGDRVLQFDKAAQAQKTDSMDNFNDRRVILYARNVCFELAEKLGLTYFLELDDDYDSFAYRLPGKKFTAVYNFDELCDVMIDFLESSPALASVAFLQGGDILGGMNNSSIKRGYKRKAMNTFFCSVKKPFRFIGRINEDVNVYTSLASRGAVFISTAKCIMNQLPTQSNGGGMTDIYKAQGTYIKSFYTVMCMPSCTKISVMGVASIRIHHLIDYEHCCPKILSETVKKSA